MATLPFLSADNFCAFLFILLYTKAYHNDANSFLVEVLHSDIERKKKMTG